MILPNRIIALKSGPYDLHGSMMVQEAFPGRDCFGAQALEGRDIRRCGRGHWGAGPRGAGEIDEKENGLERGVRKI